MEESFRCNNGQLLPVQYRCDGVFDCQDTTDETGCGKRILSKNVLNQIQAVFLDLLVKCKSKDPHFGCNGKCLEYRFLCDGIPDCPNATDEKNCSKYHKYY